MSVCLVCSQSQLCADGGWSSSHIAPALLLCLPLAERHPFSPSASLHPSLPPMPKLAFTSDGFSTDDYGLETRERKKTLRPLRRRSVRAQRHCSQSFSLRCFSVWHSPPQSETATRARVCRSSVRFPSLPPLCFSLRLSSFTELQHSASRLFFKELACEQARRGEKRETKSEEERRQKA